MNIFHPPLRRGPPAFPRRALSPTLLALAGVIGVATPAAAFTGGEKPFRDPSFDQRDYAPETQKVLAAGPAWTGFVQRTGAGWAARFDERTGTPLRFYGRGIEVGQPRDAAHALEVATAFFTENADLLGAGVEVADLVPVTNVDRDGTRIVAFQRHWQGIPVEGAHAHVRIREGRIYMGGVDTRPGLQVATAPAITADDAYAAADDALAEMGSGGSRDLQAPPDLLVHSMPIEGGYDHRLAWRVRIARIDAPGLWDTYVDAVTGEIVDRRDRIHRIGGVVNARHDRRTVTATPDWSTSPVAFGQVKVEGQSVVTDATGRFIAEAAGIATLSAGVNGTYVKVQNQSGAASITDSWEVEDGDVATMAGSGSDGDTAQLDAYVFASQAREYCAEIVPDNAFVNGQVQVKVNHGQTCNAYFDGSSINFYKAGGGCNNTARIADVVYHEFGHGFHYRQVVGGMAAMDEALSEGASDYLSATMLDDPYLGRGIYSSDLDEPFREIDSDYVWPDDKDSDPHLTGQIFGSAMWDLRGALSETLGPVDGVAHADWLWAEALAGAYDIPSSYEEILAADDDDADLSNGTPNQDVIDEVFAAHGLGPAYGSPGGGGPGGGGPGGGGPGGGGPGGGGPGGGWPPGHP